jgi:hypothetical protein
VPTCGSWNFNSGTVEGWKVGSLEPKAQHGMTTGLSTVASNGSPVLTAKFDGTKGRIAEFSVDLCPGGASLDMSKYVFKYDLFLRTTTGSRFSRFDERGDPVASTYLATDFAALLACQPFLNPASDTWETDSCDSLSTSATSITIVLQLPPTWAGDIYIDKARFELKSAQ